MYNELEVIKTAYLNEVEGEQFYRLAAGSATNAQVKQAFLYLADEEITHQTMLRHIIERLQSQEEISLDGIDPNRSPQIFNFANARENASGMELSVFSTGIILEKASVDFYREAAEKTSDQNISKILNYLAEWENTHLRTLETIYDDLKEDWWGRQQFSPS